jgi:RNA polymerase sigma-70 factor (ECF subfamily)
MLTLDEYSAAPFIESAGPRVAAGKTPAPAHPVLKTSAPSADGAADIPALTRAIQRGDAAAFARFYDLYHFRLHRFALVLARGDENLAREVCQASMTKLAGKFPAFDDEPTLWAWLCALTKNTFLDHCRARRRRERFVPIEENSAAATGAENPSSLLSEILGEALAALAPEEREILQAAYIDQRPLQELADAAGLTYKAVESRLARLRQKLKEKMLTDLRHENQS